MSNKSRRVYTGITSDLPKRVLQHRYKLIDGFTSLDNFDMLVYFEEYSAVLTALAREKEIKGWRRKRSSSSFWRRIRPGPTCAWTGRRIRDGTCFRMRGRD